MIIIVFGLPGSGKSYFAARLAKMINATYINSDVVRKTMFDTRTYSSEEKQAVYNEMLKQVNEAGRQQINLVLDATFYSNETRKMFQDGVEGNPAIIFIEIRAEESITRERIKKPRKDSEADFDVYLKIKQQWEPLADPHLILQSTDDNIEDMIAGTAAYLQSKFTKDQISRLLSAWEFPGNL